MVEGKDAAPRRRAGRPDGSHRLEDITWSLPLLRGLTGFLLLQALVATARRLFARPGNDHEPADSGMD
jgi:hypothetical protein